MQKMYERNKFVCLFKKTLKRKNLNFHVFWSFFKCWETVMGSSQPFGNKLAQDSGVKCWRRRMETWLRVQRQENDAQGPAFIVWSLIKSSIMMKTAERGTSIAIVFRQARSLPNISWSCSTVALSCRGEKFFLLQSLASYDSFDYFFLSVTFLFGLT